MVVTKQDLHRLIDEIPEYEHNAVADYLKRLRDLAHDADYQTIMSAPLDDEPLTPEDLAAIEEGESDIREGRVVSWEEVKKELFGDETDG
jgi:predicted transcriptional regulator